MFVRVLGRGGRGGGGGGGGRGGEEGEGHPVSVFGALGDEALEERGDGEGGRGGELAGEVGEVVDEDAVFGVVWWFWWVVC